MSKMKLPPTGVEHYADPVNGDVLAIVVRDDFKGGRYNFFTPDDYSLQLGENFYAKGDAIESHVHVPQERHIAKVNEFIFLKAGKLLLHLFTSERAPVGDVELRAGDCVLLTGGGHGFDVLAGAQLLEVKQGPYLGVDDKIKFTA